MISLDANYLVAAIDPATSQHLEVIALLAAGEMFSMSAVAWAEFRCGSQEGLTSEEEAAAHAMLTSIEPLTTDDAETGAELFNATGRRQRSLADCLVAATAMRLDLALATFNQQDFSRFTTHGLVIHEPSGKF